jgi:hypothetical protein
VVCRGNCQPAAETFGTPEGHAVMLDERGEAIGITIVNARWPLDRDVRIDISVPNRMEPNAEERAQAIAA